MNDNDYRSFIGDLHYPVQADRYYMTYSEAVKMLVENVYRDDELSEFKATQMMSVIDIMSFGCVFVLRVLLALLSPVIAPLFVMHDKLRKIRYLRMVYFLASYHSGVEVGYKRVVRQVEKWSLR